MPPIDAGEADDDVIIQGERYEAVYQLLEDENDPMSGVSLVGYTGASQLRKKAGGQVLLEFEVVVDQTTGTATSGEVRVIAEEEETAALTRGGVRDVWLYQADEDFPLIGLSKITLKKRVTAP